MSRTTKQLSGGGKDKFLRAVAGAVASVAPADAERIGALLAASITEVRVRREAWEKYSLGGHAPPAKAILGDAAAFDPFAFSAPTSALTRPPRFAITRDPQEAET